MIVTARLRLRAFHADDLAPLTAIYADERVMATLGGVRTADQAARSHARLSAPDPDGLAVLAIERRADGAFIGYCGLQRIGPDLPAPLAGGIEIAWGLAFDAWGHGLATEAAMAVLAATPHRPIFAFTARINARSQAVMLRLGLARRADLDFDHPALPEDSPLGPHIVFVAA